ncbi:hypothetical protein FRUB_08562 [Fimbriiglobus ruber]|uniref:Uncharacterized protein n=1 Tax=Fimbriiglobus ruber TaxID=1908690 RepID=A0A225DFR4_9BACT|nr:hypothetical protein FRUB_08562 [Fimbriiglobus ruber]
MGCNTGFGPFSSAYANGVEDRPKQAATSRTVIQLIAHREGRLACES